MENKQLNQLLDSVAVVDPTALPEELLKNISRLALKQIKHDKNFRRRYEKETGKSIYKRDFIT